MATPRTAAQLFVSKKAVLGPYRLSQALEIVSGRISIHTNRARVLGVPWELVASVGRPPIRFYLPTTLSRVGWGWSWGGLGGVGLGWVGEGWGGVREGKLVRCNWVITTDISLLTAHCTIHTAHYPTLNTQHSGWRILSLLTTPVKWRSCLH